MSEPTNPSFSRPRTAVVLGSLYRELREEGIPADLAYEIVRDTNREVAGREGLCVKTVQEA